MTRSRPIAVAFALGLLVAGLAACSPRPGEGRFGCEPLDPASCPAGFTCQLVAAEDAFRCFRSSRGYCGDGALDPGEACDGSRVPVDCADLGYLVGEPTCTAACEVDAGACRDAVAVACGEHHCCALDDAGDAWCWGAWRSDPDAWYDSLGFGVNRPTFRPVRAAAGLSLRAISAGDRHTCALAAAGEVYCWGYNGYGQLGVGNLESTDTPTRVDGGPWQAVAAASRHTCGLDAAGAAHCWGDHLMGQLGNGVPFPDPGRVSPGPVATDERFVALSAAGAHTCALTATGEARCWGSNTTFQLGSGSEDWGSSVPLEVRGDHRFASLRAGPFHTCGLDDGGQAWCWGFNGDGQLGDRAPIGQNAPVALPGDLRFLEVTPGGAHTCGLDAEGQAWCWGAGPLGIEALASLEPVLVDQAQPLTALASGQSFVCGLAAPGAVWCWGWNGAGAVGQAAPRSVPARVGTPARFVALRSQVHTTCGITALGEAFCWGDNAVQQLGDRTTTPRFSPVPAAGDARFGALSVGGLGVCGVDERSRMLCWGLLQPYSRLASIPEVIGEGQAWSDAAVGYVHACGLDPAGQAWCWGDNSAGQLGDGPTGHGICEEGSDCSAVPVPVAGGISFASLEAGFGHTCGVADDGRAYCWGSNHLSEVGDALASIVAEPRAVAIPAEVTQVSAGNNHSCALDVDGQAWCWGDNGPHGRLGDGTASRRPAPVKVAQARPFVTLAAGMDHTCGLEASGTAWCWGDNALGQLGDGTDVPHLTPVPVLADRPFVALALGFDHSCALDEEGAAWCWGRNDLAQLATDDLFSTPVRVGGSGAP
jgi:alpha-tubulin suppressor-like RCC1 family protein